MRRILKRTEPRSLVEHRATPGAAFDGCNKGDVRKALFEEQRGLCCYCCGRIAATRDGMKIEHFVAQSSQPAMSLSYQNMLGACSGGMGKPPRQQHCDTKRGDRPIRFSPPDPQRDIHPLIVISANGKITSPDPTLSLASCKGPGFRQSDGTGVWLRWWWCDVRIRPAGGQGCCGRWRVR
jgi:uncharacterized protein (TIGR02646 family)